MSRRGLGLLLLVLVAAASCDRAPRFRPPEADSTAALSADSFAVYAAQARELWETAGDDSEAPALTSRLVQDDLRAHRRTQVAARARTLLDSLGFGAEVAGGEQVAVVNLFARSDPVSGSWPFLFWREDDEVWRQRLEASGLRLLALVPREESNAESGPVASHVAVLFARTTASGQQPMAFVWKRAEDGRSWMLAQSLGADSLGGVGTAEFVDRSESDLGLISRTWKPAPGFTECPTCPHVYRKRRFLWREGLLVSSGEEVESSPYAAFVSFLGALSLGDRSFAADLVTDPSLVDAALGYEWDRSKGLWRIAPGAEERAREMVLFRGNQEAYRVRFASSGGRWRIAGFEPTSRTLE